MSDLEIRQFLAPIYDLSPTDDPGGIPTLGERAPRPRNPGMECGRIQVRVHSIATAIVRTTEENQAAIIRACDLLAEWMTAAAVVRVLGAGRALLAASVAANRLAHAGAQVSFIGGMVPMPNSARGGGIIASSASGRTGTVLEAMEIARTNNEDIKILGIASRDATEFSNLCDVFIGIHSPVLPVPNPLSALADQEELIISELLDAIVVMAGQKIGFDDEAWRRGHEDIGPTGPYAPKPK